MFGGWSEADSLKKQLDEANQELTRLSSRLVGKNQEIARLERAIVRNATVAAGAQERLEEQLAIARSGMLAAQPPKGQISIQASGEGTTTPNVALGTRGKRSWSDKDLLALLARVESGATHEALAAELGCARQNVGRLLNKAEARKEEALLYLAPMSCRNLPATSRATCGNSPHNPHQHWEYGLRVACALLPFLRLSHVPG
ncbi:hypothetical protein ACU4HD_02860 [Cupriavidus basilensis]